MMNILDLAHIDVTQSALAAGLVVLGLALLLQLRAAHKLRLLLTRDLARIFEQLDRVRFESQQLAEQGASAASHVMTRAIPAPSRPLRERAPPVCPARITPRRCSWQPAAPISGKSLPVVASAPARQGSWWPCMARHRGAAPPTDQ